ncbi:MAG: hypothetical protein R6X15_04285 [Pseudomonadota bacterium]
MIEKTDKMLLHPILPALSLAIVLGASGVEAGEAEITLKRGVAATTDTAAKAERGAPRHDRSLVIGKPEKPAPVGNNDAKLSPPEEEAALLLPAVQK